MPYIIVTRRRCAAKVYTHGDVLLFRYLYARVLNRGCVFVAFATYAVCEKPNLVTPCFRAVKQTNDVAMF